MQIGWFLAIGVLLVAATGLFNAVNADPQLATAIVLFIAVVGAGIVANVGLDDERS